MPLKLLYPITILLHNCPSISISIPYIALLFHIFHYILIISPFTMESIMWFYSDMFFDIPWHDMIIPLLSNHSPISFCFQQKGCSWELLDRRGSWMIFHRQKFYTYAAYAYASWKRNHHPDYVDVFFSKRKCKLLVCISDGKNVRVSKTSASGGSAAPARHIGAKWGWGLVDAMQCHACHAQGICFVHRYYPKKSGKVDCDSLSLFWGGTISK